MNKNGAPDEEQLWFDRHMRSELSRFDQAFEQPELDPMQLEAFVQNHRQEMKRKLWRELAFFWIVAAIVLVVVLGALNRSLALFAALQAAAGLGAIGYIGITLGKKVKRLWKNS
ncbi:hypothetical protein D3P08_18815 [Paenibacillus nanensis]|uniref:Uncharacterized protein n=1 Tax=Paenibacillus nanensis TaxID=393251 RepID=A0A3A1UQC9_9BACL|nr:DUF5345 family protein [Paenibacillus nanensis]RIX50757.1 hypothetical protein D3P08_18815 [Paenibacillus nanensis]